MMKRILLPTLFVAGLFSNSFAQTPGTLDASFNGSGLKTFTFKPNVSDDEVGASVADAQGNLYITGAEPDEEGGYAPFVFKVLPSGKLDLTFGMKGKADLEFISTQMRPDAIALQADGKIVLSGWSSGENPIVARLTPQGFRDATFNVDKGIGMGYLVFEAIATGTGATLNAIQIAANGNIFASGGTATIDALGDGNILVVGLDAQGNRRTDFGINGVVTVAFDATKEMGEALVLDDTVLYVAATGLSDDNNVDFELAAVSTLTGLPITTFGGGLGKVKLPGRDKPINDFCTSMILTNDHKLIVAGFTHNTTLNTVEKLIYKVDATGDTGTDLVNFPDIGKVIANTAPTTQTRILSVSTDPNNRLLITGIESSNDLNYKWFVSRLLANGTADAAFGDVTSPGTRHMTLPVKLLNQPLVLKAARLTDGSYLLAGSIQYNDNSQDIKVKKINNLGQDVNAYGNNNNGEAIFWTRDANGIVKDMALRSDGKLVVAGDIILEDKTVAVVALLNADGSIDETFGGTKGAIPGTVYLPSALNEVYLFSVELLPSDKIVLSGCHRPTSNPDDLDIFVAQLNKDGSADSINFNTTGYNDYTNTQGEDWGHDLVIQPNGKILVYGYLREDGQNMATVIRFNKNGTLDTDFGTGNVPSTPGVFKYSGVAVDGSTDQHRIEIKLQPGDNKIVGVTSYYNGDDNTDFLIFRLDTTGVLDSSFGPGGDGKNLYQVADPHNDYAYCLAIKPDGKILVGGTSYQPGAGGDSSPGENYALVQLTKDGLEDTLNTGDLWKTMVEKGGYPEDIIKIFVESSNAFVAAGYRQDPGTGKKQFVALRFTGQADLDITFADRGHTIVANGYIQNALMAGNALYLVGTSSNADNTPHFAQIARVKLGTGPVIRNTTLKLTNQVKTFGDQPFSFAPLTISNSPAPVKYSIVYQEEKATIHPTTGLFTILHATGDPVVVRAEQASIPGYASASAEATVYINRAIPTIVFTTQGGLVGDTIKLVHSSNAPASAFAGYGYSGGISSSVIVLYNGEYAVISGAGEAKVYVSYFASADYEDAIAETYVYGYATKRPPVANDDKAEFVFGQQTQVSFNVLNNDEAFTGTIDGKSIDLDPSLPGHQSVYVSPSLGLFEVDTTGLVTYTPFSGFIGSGTIQYTVTDSKMTTSRPGTIAVAVLLQGEAPSLRATEMITPNNDGLNDAFVIGFVDLEKQNELKIFDRNGQQLYSQNNYRNDWKGELPSGTTIENGVYYYVFIEGASGGSQRELKGAIEVRK